ncbi:YfjI family protein [Photobacterium lipolyticum]|uniref:DUF3987 domain-containing protein n=1 Tax=Photobacterium lipolyticum TaxID=266810 RepID=A0A2T3MTH9_9GAMM|nr:YfjI family protein [Photobacterium lipolyticum]PSW02560.1 hypothetical protein C9I89_18750 [Photobacterium lipolyticum]
MSDVIAIKPEQDLQPLPLIPEAIKSEPYPLDALGAVLGNAAKIIAEGIQVPPAMAGNSVLAAAALAVQHIANVNIDGRSYPISLFCLTIAESGDRKSATDKCALAPAKQAQAKLQSDYKASVKCYQDDIQVFEKEKKLILNNKKLGPDETRARLHELKEPIAPKQPNLLADEPTIEGLQKSFAKGLPSQGLFNDEGGQFFGGHAMSAEQQLKSAAGLSRLWDGSDQARTRAGEGESMFICNPRLSVHLMIQPIVAKRVLSDPILSGQGLLARFLIVAPESIAGTRLYNGMDISQKPAAQRYRQALSKAHDIEPSLDENGNLQPRELPLSAKAKMSWIKSYNAIETAIGNHQELGNIKAEASKAAEQTLRIAAVLTLIENPDATSITNETISSAIVLIGYYLNEQLRLQKQIEVNPELANANELYQWLINKGWQNFNLRKVCRNAPRFARKAKDARALLELLEEYNWIIRLPKGVDIGGKPTKEAWRLTNAI